ncbi:MAG: hypothetical protein M5U09_12545 [Gammaproteobacteria bacterium]|nr:hypothetical protein [Gammaproteobacteria bacterium]
MTATQQTVYILYRPTRNRPYYPHGEAAYAIRPQPEEHDETYEGENDAVTEARRCYPDAEIVHAYDNSRPGKTEYLERLPGHVRPARNARALYTRVR